MAEVDTIDVLDATGATKSVPTLLSVEDRIGEVQATPTSNTMLSRLKAINDSIANATLVGGDLAASATFTPAASIHTGPACNGAAATFAFGAVSGSTIVLTDATFMIPDGNAKATAWRLHLYTITPPSALSDTTAFDIPSGDRASYVGYIDLGTAIDVGSTQWVEARGINKAIKLAGTGLFGYLVNLTTVTPVAVAHTVTLIAEQR